MLAKKNSAPKLSWHYLEDILPSFCRVSWTFLNLVIWPHSMYLLFFWYLKIKKDKPGGGGAPL